MAGPSKIPLKGVDQKRLEGNKVFKKWGQSGSRNRCLEKGVGTPLQTVPSTQLIQKEPSADILQKMVFLKTSLVFSCEFCAIFQNQATKFGQLIEREKYFSSKIMLKIMSGD